MKNLLLLVIRKIKNDNDKLATKCLQLKQNSKTKNKTKKTTSIDNYVRK